MIKVVMDTNLLISYLLTKGEIISKLFKHWQERDFILLTSPQILAELEKVFDYPHLKAKITKEETEALLTELRSNAEQVSGQLVIPPVSRDPKDDKFIACAVEGKADYIVSGDNDLLDLEEYQGIEIVKPKGFITILEARETPGGKG